MTTHTPDQKAPHDWRRGQDYETYIEKLSGLRGEEDEVKWRTGDELASLFADQRPRPGRPKNPRTLPQDARGLRDDLDDDEIDQSPDPTVDPEITLSDVARDANHDRRRLGERLAVSTFYPPPARRFPSDMITYTHYAKAMRHHPKSPESADRALAFAEKHNFRTRQFESWLRGEWGEAVVEVQRLPEGIRAMLGIPPGEELVWLSAKRPEDVKDD